MKSILTWLVRSVIVSSVIIAFLSGSVSLVFADDDLHNGICECVTFVVFTEFGKRLSGTWNNAEDMANPDYWSVDHMKDNKLDASLAHIRSNSAKHGEVIIFQHDAKYSVLTKNGQDLAWVDQTSAGNGRGHIGYVLDAKYSDAEQGWYITMESANWPETWGAYIPANEEAPQFHDPKDNFNFECRNVSSEQNIFVPNGDKISFW